MEKEPEDKVEWFDSYLNKAIIYASVDYFRKQVLYNNREPKLVDDEQYTNYIDEIAGSEKEIYNIDDMVLSNAIAKLSDIEQAVIFLRYNKDLTREETSKILDILETSTSRIAKRALKKLRNLIEEDYKDEK